MSLVFETMETARTALLGLGPTAEGMEPRELRASIMEWAEGLLTRYSSKTRDQSGLLSTNETRSSRKE